MRSQILRRVLKNLRYLRSPATIRKEAGQVKPHQRVSRPKIERMIIRGPGIVRTVDRIVTASHLKVRREAGQARNQFCPADPEGLTVAVRGVVGHSWNREIAFAVVSLGEIDRSGKMAAAKNIAGCGHAASI